MTKKQLEALRVWVRAEIEYAQARKDGMQSRVERDIAQDLFYALELLLLTP